MARQDPRAPGAGQSAMFTPTPVDPREDGRHQKAIEASINARRARDGDQSDVYAAAETALRAVGWELDRVERSGKLFAISKLVDPYLNVLREMHMTPESRRLADQDDDDQLATLLDELSNPTIRDTA